MQLEKSFYQAPTKDMANQIRLARAVVNMQTKNVKSLERVKSALRNFIRVVFPEDMYTKPETLKLVQEVQNATLENIKEVKSKLMDMATTKIVKGLESKIKKLLNNKSFDKLDQLSKDRGTSMDVLLKSYNLHNGNGNEEKEKED